MTSISNTDQQILLIASIITTYVGGVMLVLGTVGNLMNIIVFCCLKSYRSLPTSSFLAMTSFAGQLYLTFSLGFQTLSEWVGYDIASSNLAICKSHLYIRYVSVKITGTCLCLASLDRYLMTSRSVRRRELITLKRARLLICVCVVLWMCAEIPLALYGQNLTSFELCIPSSNYSAASTYLNVVFAIFLPITILSVFGLLTWKNLGNTRLTALNSQVTKMILLEITVVTVSSIPTGCFIIYTTATSVNRPSTPTEFLVFILTQLISTTQPCGSFYLYMIVSSAFRTSVKEMLHNILYFWKPRRTHQMTPLAGIVVSTRIPNIVV